MIDHILVALDGSPLAERVLPHLYALARPFNSRVTLLRVVSRSETSRLTERIDPLDFQMLEAEARSYLNKMTIRLTKAGLNVRNDLLHGDPATRIVEFVHQQNVDLLLLSSHGESGLTGWNISSVVQKTVIRVNKPTMIIRAYQAAPPELPEAHYTKLLIPLDGSSRAECVLPVVTRLAEFHNAKVYLAHIIRQPELPRRAPLSQEENELVNQITQKNYQEADRYLQQLQSDYPLDMEVLMTASDNIVDTMHELVNHVNPDLMIMSAHGYSGSHQRPYGSLALGFIAFGTKPMLIIQDIPSNYEVLPSTAELASREHPGH